MTIETPPPAAAALVGQVLDGRYRILHLIGAGGMGEVYAAEHVHIAKRLALKLLRQDVLANPEAVTRFRQEARAASSIGHRNIIEIEDFGQLPDGRVYMCMELLDGAPLGELMVGGLDNERLLSIMIQTTRGLGAAHKKGIVHRDLKPDNIFVTQDNGADVPKLLDFGIAKVSDSEGQNRITRTGAVFGTPYYMSPEQALGNSVDLRSDIYSLGIIMYEAFSGALPFSGESFLGVLMLHVNNAPPPVEQQAAQNGRMLPPGLGDVIRRCMQKLPDARFASMNEVTEALLGVYQRMTGVTYPDLSNTGNVRVPGRPSSAPITQLPTSLSQAARVTFQDAAPAASLRPKRKGLWIGIGAVLTLAIMGGGWMWMQSGDADAKAEDVGKGVVIAAGQVRVDGARPDAASAGTLVPIAPPLDATPLRDARLRVDAAPTVTAISVLVASSNVPKFDMVENGKRIAVGPDAVVIQGEPRTLILRAKGYVEQTLVIDGSQIKQWVTFEKKGKPGKRPGDKTPTSGGGKPDGNSGTSSTSTDKPDCSKYSKACAKEYCAANPTKPVCLAEQ